ncbi:MAG: 2-C-methyl-D-erythritol 4-phosphate cytidylyltransferase [Chlamydiia bacterium]|nr:2-C-methyl-D-erythritol 4-phosphate cytidylyltransferase [Chlamydiia bacterium]MCH9615078.1 2-C-methyl-D-erythritol 4-phosphate cytidylyltransferase [Chlamydiia bacterium]MCH9628600.1 2-C-methyl-D-erythritol 4-phosphate cytidylyltransferase [Chlamydiia bacterium]
MPAMKVAVILLAGGTGTRMGTSVPKQFLDLDGKPIARYSFDLFKELDYVTQVVVVCPEIYREIFPPDTTFANPGERRQDSVYNGFLETARGVDLICIHDAARPFISKEDVEKLLQEALVSKAATLACPVRYTVKEVTEGLIQKTLNRTNLYEIHTPQMISPELLEEGFKKATDEEISVTDDVSLVELLKRPVSVVEGSPKNIKITYPDDLQ